jgi:hypothetical protein
MAATSEAGSGCVLTCCVSVEVPRASLTLAMSFAPRFR